MKTFGILYNYENLHFGFDQLVSHACCLKIVCVSFVIFISYDKLSRWGHHKQKLIMTSLNPKQNYNCFQYKHQLYFFCVLSRQYFLPLLESKMRAYVQNKDILSFLVMNKLANNREVAPCQHSIYAFYSIVE